ncbi:Ribokinase [Glycine soja]
MMSSESVLPLPENPIIVGFGGVGVDFLAVVPSFPKPDSKIRTTEFTVQGGGNNGNTMTCAARLGLKPRIISKVSNDGPGKTMLEELEAEGVDTSFFVVSKEGTSPFSYIIVDNQSKTRTCIFTPGYPEMVPQDLSRANLLSALDGARVVYFDARMPDNALVIAQEAFHQNISILIDAERPREGLNDLLSLADYVAWTEASSIPRALVSIILRLPRLKFAIVTLGKDGCIMLEKCVDDEGSHIEEMDVDSCFVSLTTRKEDSTAMPTCIPSPVTKLRAEGIEESVCGRLYYGTSEKIPPSELVDTTGAGDAFVGAVLYSICANLSLEKMLPFASYVLPIVELLELAEVADDSQGRSILDELQADGVDTSFIVVSKEGISPFTYIIVDNQTKTRTCIHTAGYPPMIPDDLSKSSLLSALDGVKIAYFDGRLPDTALVVAQEAVRKNIPILIDAERPREGLDDLLKLADYVVCSANFPAVIIFPPVPLIHPVNCKIEGRGDRNSSGKLYVETAESIPPLELVDTTGAGDAFIGAVIYAICAKITPETMISFAANVAGAKCRDLGARSGLPYRADPRIASFVLEKLISSA